MGRLVYDAIKTLFDARQPATIASIKRLTKLTEMEVLKIVGQNRDYLTFGKRHAIIGTHSVSATKKLAIARGFVYEVVLDGYGRDVPTIQFSREVLREMWDDLAKTRIYMGGPGNNNNKEVIEATEDNVRRVVDYYGVVDATSITDWTNHELWVWRE